jgi:tetratricopeptide (TPR) repeat protein
MLASAQTSSAELKHHLERAQAALQANQPEAAKRELQSALALDPKNVSANNDLGVIEFADGDYQSAANHFHAALTLRPSLTKAQALLAICDLRLGKRTAQAELEFSFSKLNDLKMKDPKLRTQVGLELAAFYDRAGSLDRATPVLQTLVDLNSDNPDILYMAQRVYNELADDTLNKLAIVAPDSARMQQVIAERLVNEGDLQNAIDHYRKALGIDFRLPGVHFELAEAIVESSPSDTGAQTQAQTELDSAIKIDGDSAKAECEFGRLSLLQSQPEQALAHYRQAYELDPNEVQAQMGLAKLLLADNPREAVKYLRMAVQSDPLNATAHYQLAQGYRRLHMTEMAQKEIRLFQEIKQTKRQVQALYRQMNRQMKPEADQILDEDTPDKQ